jgi:SRSO17 transposase
MSTSVAWEHELQSWLDPFLKPLRHPARRRMCPLYVAGLISPGERKSLQPMAARVAPADYDQLHHFVAVGPWDEAPLEAELLAQANRLVGGPDAILVIDDTALLKKGTHSVGVASQYAGVVGKNANCQTLVSLTLAKNEVPVPIVLRLFLPETWIRDPGRLQHAGVPEAFWVERAKPEIALAELKRLLQAGVSFGAVLADAGYGISAPFRQALSALGLLWAVGIPRIQKVYASKVKLVPPPVTRGGLRKTLIPDQKAIAAEAMLAKAPWHRITWRRGTKGPMRAKFAAARVRVADGTDRSASARRRSLARGRASHLRRAQILPVQPAAGHSTEALGLSHQGALGVRAGAPAAQGRTRARSPRGPLLARAAPTRADDADRLPVPAAPAFAGCQRGKKEKPVGHRHNRHCQPFGACCLIIWRMPCACDVPSAAPTSRSIQS